MKILMVLSISVFLAAGFVDPLQACIPGIEMIGEYTWDPAGPVSVCIFPDGEARAFLAGGQAVTASLRFPVIDFDSDPPFDSVSVEWYSGGPQVICQPYDVELTSDPEGWVSWNPDFRGGGHRGPDEDVYLSLWVPVCPNQLLEIYEGVYFNSPDISGDLQVNLMDIHLFSVDFFADYDYRSDFNWDGVINLLDIEILAQAVSSACE